MSKPARGKASLTGKISCHPLGASCETLSLTTLGSREVTTTFAAKLPISDYMDDTPPKENPPADFNKIDLAQLQGFSFGTQWSQDKTSPSDRRDRDERPRRDFGNGPAERRDRRTFRKPAGAPSGPGPGPSDQPQGGDDRARRSPGGQGDFRDRRSGPGSGPDRGPRFGGRPEPVDRGPYDSPYFSAVFYPEDSSFNALVKTIRSSARTIELFEIARTVIGKADRFVVVVSRKQASSRPGDTAAPSAEAQPLYISVPDGLPFESDDAALNHVLSTHLAQFFDTSEVETEPPKGNYQVINKCGVTGELLGPPNYHRYSQIIQQHFAARVTRMSFEAFRSRIESVREPEAVAQWLEKMKKITRYTWKLPVPEGQPVPTFDNFEDAKVYLITQARDKVVRTAESARFHGKIIETMPMGEIRRAIEGALERQRRFPLDTANTLRGRLRREHFTIFKKGSKGVSYVCAVKRKFRTPGQVFSESIGSLISFIEATPLVKASELPKRFLGISLQAEPAAPDAPAPVELTVEQREKIGRMQSDLVWLVREGYVTEFIDGGLYAPPPMVEARRKEVEADEHDPEAFPEAPAAPAAATEAAPSPAEAPAAEAAPSEAPASPQPEAPQGEPTA